MLNMYHTVDYTVRSFIHVHMNSITHSFIHHIHINMLFTLSYWSLKSISISYMLFNHSLTLNHTLFHTLSFITLMLSMNCKLYISLTYSLSDPYHIDYYSYSYSLLNIQLLCLYIIISMLNCYALYFITVFIISMLCLDYYSCMLRILTRLFSIIQDSNMFLIINPIAYTQYSIH